MIELFGPTYRYAGERLEKPEIIWINDHCYNEEDQCFHVQKLIEAGPCDPQLHTIIFDHVGHDDALSRYNTICFPIFLAAECQEFIDQNIATNWDNKTHTFNFSLNKPRIHRNLLLKEIERLNLTNFTHSLPWQFNNVNNIPVTDYKFGPEKTMEQGIKNGNFKNALTYDALLKTTVFEPSCISIITEPCYYEQETIHTEKTFMAIMAGTIPIWFGGWKLPQTLKRFGFDVFDDIVDHSYETLENPHDRCVQALQRNIGLLRDFDRTKQIIQNSRTRLEHNRDLLLSNPFIEECFQITMASQNSLRLALLRIVPTFRQAKFRQLWKEYKQKAQELDYYLYK